MAEGIVEGMVSGDDGRSRWVWPRLLMLRTAAGELMNQLAGGAVLQEP